MRLRTPIIVFVLLTVGLTAGLALRTKILGKPAHVLKVPEGDREIAWIQTSTNGASWERFVAGLHRTCRDMPGLDFDDSRAFLERTTATPEVVLSWNNRPGKLRIRWYKQTTEMGTKQWVDALAERDPPPLAIIGGGSSDRARDLARDLNARTQWKGKRPLLLITTATANDLLDENREPYKLMQVYPDHSFRFCFTNEQMAAAVVDFVWHMPDLRPRGGPPDGKGIEPRPVIFPVHWEDDPYSIDLSEKFRHAVKEKTKDHFDQPFISHPPYSVGTFDRVNHAEAEFAQFILAEMPMQPGQRSLIILPTATNPARRFLRALAGESPLIGKHLVAVTGDAISFNDVYRDGGLLWNVRDVPVPLVFFTHQNPIDWDAELLPPTGTDDALLFADLARVLASSAYSADGRLVADSDAFRDNLRAQTFIPFDANGNREEGSEFVVCVRPEISDVGRINAQATLEVWNRLKGGAWKQVKPTETLLAPYAPRSSRRNTSP